MINYSSKFSARLSELAAPIRELSKDKVPFNWGPEHQQPSHRWSKKFQVLWCWHITTQRGKPCCRQMQVQKVLVLVCCKKKNLFILQVKLLQCSERLCGHRDRIACRGLGNREIPPFFICQPFHLRNWPESAWSYIIEEFEPSNSKITADTDQDFCLPLTVRYILGVTNQLADCLSGLSYQKDNVKLPKLHNHQITSQLNARSDSLNDIRVATQEDDELALLKHTIMHGMAKLHQRGSKWDSTILDLQRGADSGRWDCLEGHTHCYSPHEMSCYPSTYTQRTFGSW